MRARWTYGAAAALALLQLGCDSVLGLHPNPPTDAGVPAVTGTGGRGGAGVAAGGGAGAGVASACPGLLAYYTFEGDAKDQSGGGHDIVAENVAPAAGVRGGAFAFDGATSHMRVTSDQPTTLGAHTLCAWVKPAASAPGLLAQPLFARGSSSKGDILSLTSGKLPPAFAGCGWGAVGTDFLSGMPFIDTLGGGACPWATFALGQLSPDVWSFICYAEDGTGAGSGAQFFVNHSSSFGQGSNVPVPISSLTIGSSDLGGDSTGASFHGVIDEVSVWNRALSSAELQAVQRFGPACAPSGVDFCGRPPSVGVRLANPGAVKPLMAGDTDDFDLSITNTNSPACADETFQVVVRAPDALTVEVVSGAPIPAGQTGYVTLHVTSKIDTPPGSYPFFCDVTGGSGPKVTASDNYILGSRPTSPGILLVPDGEGHFDGSNAAGVVGYWWSSGDAYGADNVLGHGTCPAAGFPLTDCSVLTRPKPGTPFPPPPSGRHGQCASGISAQAFSNADGYPDFGTFWGNRIGFNLANPGTLADGPTLIGPYDATAHGIVGFAFDIDTVIPWERLRVAFPTVGTEDYPAYWMGPPMDLVPLPGGGAGPAGPGGPPFIRPGHYELLWSEVGGSGWGSVFDPTMIEAIQFQVLGSETGPVQFDFCVDNITLLRN